ncbi:TerD family protein [Gordonia desulfuricans]|uniref:TerD family protein n=1 Tax=Gordonia desulfuricans TaxID=89051 RepID=A0A7K3LRP2_9ACTN|nr:TerD family protein [Gordonia desulfuricans]NDK90766.1 TerD family protein [Gordonia desulfuricans]
MTTTPDRLAVITVAIEWDGARTPAGIDLDLAALVLGDDGTVLSDDYFAFFNQHDTPEKAVRLVGGNAHDPRESLTIDTLLLPPKAREVAIVVTVYDNADVFGRFEAATISAADSSCGALAEYSLSAGQPDVRALVYARLVLEDGKWRFRATAERHASLLSIASAFGVNT